MRTAPAAVQEDFALAMRLATIADNLTLRSFRKAQSVSAKHDGSPVTAVDRMVEQALTDEIRRARPADGVLGEESGLTRTGARQWVIDPIDHTRHYIRGNPEFGTLISLTEGEQTRLAVVTAPALGHRWWAVSGHGAWKDNYQIKVSTVRQMSAAYLAIAGFREWHDQRLGIGKLLDACAYPTGCPGGFLYSLFVAEGRLDVFLEPWGKIWDHIGVALIVREAGGMVTTLEGEEPRGGSLLATNGTLHEAALRLLH